MTAWKATTGAVVAIPRHESIEGDRQQRGGTLLAPTAAAALRALGEDAADAHPPGQAEQPVRPPWSTAPTCKRASARWGDPIAAWALAVVDGAVVTLVVDPRHWLDQHGQLPTDNLPLRRRILRIVQFIEAGALLDHLHGRETTIPCQKRPRGKPCLGLMWVMKTAKHEILAFCPVCKTDEAVIHHWEGTQWAEGLMDPVPMTDQPPEGMH